MTTATLSPNEAFTKLGEEPGLRQLLARVAHLPWEKARLMLRTGMTDINQWNTLGDLGLVSAPDHRPWDLEPTELGFQTIALCKSLVEAGEA